MFSVYDDTERKAECIILYSNPDDISQMKIDRS